MILLEALSYSVVIERGRNAKPAYSPNIGRMLPAFLVSRFVSVAFDWSCSCMTAGITISAAKVSMT